MIFLRINRLVLDIYIMMFSTITKAQVLMLIMKKNNHTNLTHVTLAEMILGMPWIVESKRGPKKASLTFTGRI